MVAIDSHSWYHAVHIFVPNLILEVSLQLLFVRLLLQISVLERDVGATFARATSSSQGRYYLLFLCAEVTLANIPSFESGLVLPRSAWMDPTLVHAWTGSRDVQDCLHCVEGVMIFHEAGNLRDRHPFAIGSVAANVELDYDWFQVLPSLFVRDSEVLILVGSWKQI
jgi:hypothetical protein